MNNEEIEQTIKGLQENQEQAIKLLQENVELKKKVKQLEERLNKASQLVRSRTYSVYTKKKHETKTDIENEKYEELMRYLESNTKNN